ASLPYPTLALTHRRCLAGGPALALASRSRLLPDAPGRTLALPAVRLGAFRGWGGASPPRALRCSAGALPMMLTGRRCDARRSAALGLADARVPTRLLEQAARKTVLSGRRPRRARGLPALLNRWPLNALAAAQARRRIAQKDPQGHYPAPPAII